MLGSLGPWVIPYEAAGEVVEVVAARRPPRRWTLAVLLVAFVLLAAAGSLARFYTDLLWFEEVGKTSVFWGQLAAKVTLGLLAGIGTAAIVGVNLWLVERLSPTYELGLTQPTMERYRHMLEPYLRPLRFAIAGFLGLVVGLQASSLWEAFLLWRNRVPFGETDAQFGRDISFYVFELPFQRAVFGWLLTTLILSLILVAAGYYLLGGIRLQGEVWERVTPNAQAHLLSLVGVIILLKAWGYWLDQAGLLFSERGATTGASYTDVHAQLPALRLLVLVALLSGVLFFVGAWTRGVLVPVISFALLAVASLLVGGVYPAVVQRFQVEPQESRREAPYIARTIEATRKAFDLEDIEVREFPAAGDLSREEVESNRGTMENIRLWEPTVLQQGIQSLQAIGPYYEFGDVDVDRYLIDGELRQVMIAAREIDPTRLEAGARTWQNLHLAYTHGYGVVAVQVNTATEGGQPIFVVQGFDQEDAKIPVVQPRIYYGESGEGAPEFVVVGTRQDEIDKPEESGAPATFRYDGKGGIQLSNPLRRLAFSLRFRDFNLLISGNLTSESRLMFNRNINDRVEQVAPFLKWDGDPYVAVVDGRIVYIRDGYTTTDHYPYVERIDLAQRARRDAPGDRGVEGRANYIRNSVKAVVDAYDGTVTLYAFDPEDPILQAWQQAFPKLFTPREQISPSLAEHLRYPEDLFAIQTDRYQAYHVTDPQAFYAQRNLWALPRDVSGQIIRGQDADGPALQTSDERMRPYYLLTRLPGEEEEQFLLVMPFTPNRKDNMAAYLAVRSDPGGSYGRVTQFSLPLDRPVLGPSQVNATILANDRVAEELNILNREGSTVTMGNLLTVPVSDSLLHVQPIFVQRAGGNPIPELRRVAVYFNGKLGYDETLWGAIGQILPLPGEEEQPAEPSEAAPEPPTEAPPSEEVAGLLQQAQEAFDAADAALRNGNLAEYQRQIARAQELVQQALARSTSPTTTTVPR